MNDNFDITYETCGINDIKAFYKKNLPIMQLMIFKKIYFMNTIS